MKTHLFVISQDYISGAGFGMASINKSYDTETFQEAWKKAINAVSIPNIQENEANRLNAISIRYLGELVDDEE